MRPWELISAGDFLVGERNQRLAAGAHLDGNILERFAAETQAGRLPVNGAAEIFKLARGQLFELIHRKQESF